MLNDIKLFKFSSEIIIYFVCFLFLDYLNIIRNFFNLPFKTIKDSKVIVTSIKQE